MAKILIVEDETIVAMSIQDTLVSVGYDVCGIAKSGQKAIEMVTRNLPDLVIMDIKINGPLDGIDVANTIKNKYRTPYVFLTAYSDTALLERVKQTEPFGYIVKPFKSSELESVVEVALYKSKMEKKIHSLNRALEIKVERRTKKLADEIRYRKLAEKKLKEKADYLEQANKALKSMLENREAEKRAIEESLLLNIRKYIFPYIELIKNKNPTKEISQTLEILKDSLENMISPASKTLFAKYSVLTPQEAKIADLIKYGRKTKEIADLLNIAPSSVSTYRNSIRKKMGLLNSSANLESFLNSYDS